jgi:hypothetical protein
MRRSLPVRDLNEDRAESRTRWLVRHGVVAWLLVLEPVSLALTLDRALPRMPSFDVVSKVQMHEVDNALLQVGKEIATRYDFRDTGTTIERTDEGIILRSNSENRVEAALSVLRFHFPDEPMKERIERSGDQRWLVVKSEPAPVWNTVREFWQETGFVIDSEYPEAGVMETDWVETYAKLPDDSQRISQMIIVPCLGFIGGKSSRNTGSSAANGSMRYNAQMPWTRQATIPATVSLWVGPTRRGSTGRGRSMIGIKPIFWISAFRTGPDPMCCWISSFTCAIAPSSFGCKGESGRGESLNQRVIFQRAKCRL